MEFLSLILGTCVLSIIHGTTVENLKSYQINPKAVTISGIGGITPLFHTVYSETIKGMASINGVPFGCMRGHLVESLFTCVSSTEDIDVQKLVHYTSDQARAGQIDPINNLYNSPIYIWAGLNDTFIRPGASKKMETFYRRLAGPSHVKTVFAKGAQHNFPTENYGQPCGELHSPFIGNCHTNLAFELLDYLHGGIAKPTGIERLTGQFLYFDQTEFIPHTHKPHKRWFLNKLIHGAGTIAGSAAGMMGSMMGSMMGAMLGGHVKDEVKVESNLIQSFLNSASNAVGVVGDKKLDGEHSLGDVGFAYIPTACSYGTVVCKLHVVFHGCGMEKGLIGDKFAKNAGYNMIGELNNIIILYPQIASQNTGNPNGCWDWWGYTGNNFDTKEAVQLKTIMNMINRIKGTTH